MVNIEVRTSKNKENVRQKDRESNKRKKNVEITMNSRNQTTAQSLKSPM